MILRVCVVIPAFDNPRTVSQVIKDVLAECPFPVLVIDDGSETPVTNILYHFEVKQALENGRLRVIRFEWNRGKGAALRHAISDLVGKGFTHMLSVDADGRTLAREISKLTDLARKQPWDLILGNRGMKSEPPGRLRRWGHRLLNTCVRFETGSRLKDAESGFRVYPLFALQMMRFRTNRYDWDIEVLIRLLWSGIKVREVDVETAVYNPAEHILHRNPLLDSLRLSALNLMLISVAVLRSHASPVELGLSAGIGVFVGCTPAIGFHTIIMVALGLLFPLNFVAMWAASHISMPMLFPFLLLGEVYIGQHWLGIPTSTGIMGHFLQWAAGSVVLGALLSIPVGLAVYFIARAMQTGETLVGSDAGQDRNQVRPGLMTNYFGLQFTRLFLPVVALWRYVWLMRARRGLYEYYRVQEPDASFWRRQWLTLRHLYSCAWIQADASALAYGVSPEVVAKTEGGGIRGEEESSTGRAKWITAHVGCFEVAASGLKPIPRPFYADRSIEKRFELIPFLGKLAPFDVTPFYRALRSREELVFVFGVMAGPGYELHAARPRRCILRSDAPEELQVIEWTERFVRQVESFARNYPDQWFNLFPFWSSIPQLRGGTENRFLEELPPPVQNRPGELHLNKNT